MKRGRPTRKVNDAVEKVTADEESLALQRSKISKPNVVVQKYIPEESLEAVTKVAQTGRGRKPAAKAVKEPTEAKAVKKGRRAAPEVDEEEDTTNGDGEQAAIEAPPPAKKGRGKKVVAENVEVVPEEIIPAKKSRGKATGKAAAVEVSAPVENGAQKKVQSGKEKATKAAVRSEVDDDPPAEPVKKGRGKAKDDAPKEEATELPAVVGKPGRGRKKAAVVTEEPEASPAILPKEQKKGRGRKASANDAQPGFELTIRARKKPPTVSAVDADDENLEEPFNGVTERKKKKTAEPPAVVTLQGDDTEKDLPVRKPKTTKVTKKEAPPKMNKCATAYEGLSFELGKEWNLKISSWNVAGLRSWVGKGGLDFLEHEKPDIMCVQETKCTEDQLPDEARQIKGYHPYWLCKPGGYAGVAIYSKKMPFNVTYGLGDKEQDEDGRLLTAEYEKFYLVCVYVPNAGKKLVTLPKRLRWNEKFHQYLKELDNKKPVILCGDMNVAHEEIDLANPKTNKKNAGFTQEERDGLSDLLSLGFVDTYRQLYPEQKSAYTFWTYMGNARSKNVGWRLDYFIASERLASKVVDNVIRTQVYGSDHCPITLFLNL